MKKLAVFSIVAAMFFSACNSAQQAAYPPQYGTPFDKVPDRSDVTMYQVNIRAFGKDGNFKGVIARLDSIKALGINVVYLMPTYPVGVLKSTNSPYCVRNYDEVNPEFGTLDDLRALIDGAHKRNMAVMLDWVANHTSFDNPWTKNKSWYLLDSAGNISHPPGTPYTDVAQLNFKNADMRLALIKSMKSWVLRVNADGFRCDFADAPPDDFWKQTIDTLRNIKSHKLLLLAEGSRKTLYNDGFDYTFGFNFFGNLKDIYAKDKSVRSIDTLNINDYAHIADGQQIVRYITNHDVNGSDGTPLELFGGKRGSMAAFVVVAYMKGIPLVYNGQEVGMDKRIPFPFTSPKVNWSVNADVTAEYKKIIALRNSSEAIRRGKLTSYTTHDVCAFTKEAGTQKILVISNFRNKPVTFSVPANLANTGWKDAFNDKPAKLAATLTLQPYAYQVLKN